MEQVIFILPWVMYVFKKTLQYCTLTPVVVVYHITIVAIGHGLLKKFWPMVIGRVLRTAGSTLFESMQTRLLR